MTFIAIMPCEIGEHTYVGEGSHISQHTKIGRYCSIANLCTIGAQPHSMEKASTYPFEQPEPRPTIIGNDIWIGANSVVLGGVTIGDGAVIGAGSVVTRSVPSYAVVYGNPARFRRWRFDEKTRARLQLSRWWLLDWDGAKSFHL